MMKYDICFLESCSNSFRVLARWINVLTFCCNFTNRTQEAKELGLELHPPALVLTLQDNNIKERLSLQLATFNSDNGL